MNKAVFLDRDGTINRDFGYVYQKEKLEFMPGVLEALKRIREAGFKLIIVTNQSGIGRGYFTLEQYREFEAFLLETMEERGVKVDGVYFCPHGPEESCRCRKPQTGMFEQAARDFDIDWASSYAVGDKERDLSICDKREVYGVLYGSREITGENRTGFLNWTEAADYILAGNGK